MFNVYLIIAYLSIIRNLIANNFSSKILNIHFSFKIERIKNSSNNK